MRVMVRVADDGRVCAARVVASDMPDSMNACVLQTLAANDYPRPAGGCRQQTVPLSFVPDDTK
jgi:hypothetical protein